MRMQAPEGGADIEGRYRYSLWRAWDTSLNRLAWIMLNPSKADGLDDDRTIRKVELLSKAFGFGSFVVANLFAWRATDPKELRYAFGVGSPVVGQRNDDAIREAVVGAYGVVVAFGGVEWCHARALAVLDRLPEPVMCLAVTQTGYPRHPLYMKNSSTLQRFEGLS